MGTMTLDFVNSKTGEVTTVKAVKQISLVTTEKMIDHYLELGKEKVESNLRCEPNALVIEVALTDGTFKYYDIKSTYDIYKM